MEEKPTLSHMSAPNQRPPRLAVVIRLIGSPSTMSGQTASLRTIQEPGADALYLQSYDPEGQSGIGTVTWTGDLSQAKRFPDIASAGARLNMVPACRPVRADGRPNRPLAAYHLALEVVQDD